MCSFDLQDMYTNIPVADAIECWNKHLVNCNAPPKVIRVFLEIAKTCMAQNYFQFKGRFYRQHSDLSMGSKLSPY